MDSSAATWILTIAVRSMIGYSRDRSVVSVFKVLLVAVNATR